MEAYVAPGRPARRARRDRRPARKPYYHLVLLARDATGYRNLVKLSSLAYTEGFYAKPRVDRELLAKYSEGSSSRRRAWRARSRTHLLDDDYERARATPRAGTRTSSRIATTSRCRRTTPRARRGSTTQIFGLGEGPRAAGRRDERRALPAARRSRRARRPALHRARQGPRRRRPDALRPRASTSRARPRSRERFPDRPTSSRTRFASPTKPTSRSRRSTHVPSFPLPAGVGERKRAADPARRRRAPANATAIRCPTTFASGSTTSSASSPRRATPATSSSSPTSSRPRATAASRSDPGAARPPARSSRTRCASPTSARSSSTCSSSAS